MPITATSFGIGALALAGFPGFSGFFSKDSILEAVAERGAWVPLGFLMTAAFLTAFYMGRTYVLAFMGKARGRANQAHESQASMTGPLVALSAGAVGVGWFGHAFAGRLGQAYDFHLGAIGAVATLLGLSGLGISVWLYRRQRYAADQWPLIVGLSGLVNAAYVDRTFTGGFRVMALPLARAVGWFDRYIVDGLINVTGWLGLATSKRLQRLQTGNALDYIMAVVVGTLLVIAWGVGS
jgi:NADH-quinone oxidoreductase subunit L